LGYAILDPSRENLGFMSEAVACVIDHGFSVLNLNRIEAWTATNNEPSIRILKKNNFVYEGLLQQRLVIDGKFLDCFMFALLREKYVG
jgi:ribosomal-protein-alanine N-acetyltransferase